MGTVFKLVLYSSSPDSAAAAARAAFGRVAELDSCLSDYQPKSELNRLSRRAHAAPVAVSEDVWNVLRLADDVSRRTDGAFDVTVGPIVKLWRRARMLRALPTAPRLAKALQQIDYLAIKYLADQSIRLSHANMRLDVGGIAKGYAADEALAVMRQQGITQALVDAGGDVSVGNPPPGETGWLVSIRPFDDPDGDLRGIRLANRSVATSGDAYRFVEIDGLRYSHIVDPRTGLGLTTRRAATVVAPSGAIADALASALCVLGAERGFGFIREFDAVSALVQTAQVQEEQVADVVEETSPGFPVLLSAPETEKEAVQSHEGG